MLGWFRLRAIPEWPNTFTLIRDWQPVGEIQKPGF